MTLKAVIFDVDGTLADTEEAHRLAFNAGFRDFGLPWEWSTALYRELLAVAGGRERIRHYCRRCFPTYLADPLADKIITRLHSEKTRHYVEAVARGEVAPRPGVLRLIRQLRADGVRLAIATTTTRANVDALLAASFSSLPADTFEIIGAGEQAGAKKPAPDIYLWVLERLGLAPEDCLAVEDSRNGVVAARAAGLPVLVTECAWTRGEDFADALAVFSDLGEPAAPHRVVRSPSGSNGHVDAMALRDWHREWQADCVAT